MGRNKKPWNKVLSAAELDEHKFDDIWKRQRKERINHSPSILQNVDVHGILFAVLAVVFVVYPLAQYFLGL